MLHYVVYQYKASVRNVIKSPKGKNVKNFISTKGWLLTLYIFICKDLAVIPMLIVIIVFCD